LLGYTQQSKVNGNGYPAIPFQRSLIPVWTTAQAMAYLEERIKLHTEAESLPDEQLPECTDQEKWERQGKVALMKKDRKSAVKLFDNLDFANVALEDAQKAKKGTFYLVERPGERVRCERYCNAKNFCYQYKRESAD